MDRGVTIVDPDTTYIDFDANIEAGARILPFTVIQSGVTLGENCTVGPFAYLKHGTVLDREDAVDSFVKINNNRPVQDVPFVWHGSKEGKKP